MQNKKKANWGSLARLLRFLWQDYKLSLSIAFVLIVVASDNGIISHQVVMSTNSIDTAIIHDDDTVCILDR